MADTSVTSSIIGFEAAAAEALIARIQSLLNGLAPNAPDLTDSIEKLCASGGAVEIELVPTGRAGEFRTRLQPSDALLELLPALRTGDANAL